MLGIIVVGSGRGDDPWRCGSRCPRRSPGYQFGYRCPLPPSSSPWSPPPAHLRSLLVVGRQVVEAGQGHRSAGYPVRCPVLAPDRRLWDLGFVRSAPLPPSPSLTIEHGELTGAGPSDPPLFRRQPVCAPRTEAGGVSGKEESFFAASFAGQRSRRRMS